MRYVLMAALMLAGCGSDEISPEVQVKMDADFERYRLQEACSKKVELSVDEQGELAQAEADVAIGEVAAKASEANSGQFREMVAADMGIPPSQANGWRDVMKGRGRTGQNTVDRINADLKAQTAARDEACQQLNATGGAVTTPAGG